MSDQIKGEEALRSRTRVQWAGLFAGIGLFAYVLASPPPVGLSAEGWLTAGLASLMVCWWITEAIPIPATSLLPMVVLPLAGVTAFRETSGKYMDPTVVLLMAGFIVAKAIERWRLHERIALFAVDSIGVRRPALIAGFMIAAALLSMWISNTATALMMTPIGLSVAAVSATGATGGGGDDDGRFRTALLLSVAYACSIGGLATPVGSPTNLIVIGFLADQDVVLDFAGWMRFGLPTVLVMLPLAWGVLALHAGRETAGGGDGAAEEGAAAVRETVRAARARLGPMSRPEARTLGVFACIAAAWVLSGRLRTLPGLEVLSDPMIAVAGAIAFFVLPSGADGARSAPLLNWRTAERIPWGVVLLFGGGLSLAAAIGKTGLAAYMAGFFTGLGGMPDLVVILALTVMVLMLTEVTSNVATVSALLPMIGAIAVATGADLVTLAAPVGLAASCAFMLPMATGPNAVAYAAGGVPISRMAGVGVWINMIGALMITFIVSLTY